MLTLMTLEEKPFFASHNLGFAAITAEDELLHPERNALVQADSLTETQYFGFSVPEAGIHSFNYLWHHPNLHVLSGVTWVWSGIKLNAVSAELCDIRTYMNDSALKDDLHEYRLDSGYGVKILEPLRRFHLSYADPVRDNAIDLIYEAIAEPVMFGDGNHFEQPMHVKGELVLRGQRHAVDCFNVRDRSWGKPRPETNQTMPPISWMTGIFHRGLAFNCTVCDQASSNPELSGAFALPDAKTLFGGWIQRDGTLGRVMQARKRVERSPGALLPMRIDLQLRDEHGRVLDLRGELIASCPWQSWGNTISNISMMRWECEGHVAYGDCQEALWNDYYNHMAAR